MKKLLIILTSIFLFFSCSEKEIYNLALNTSLYNNDANYYPNTIVDIKVEVFSDKGLETLTMKLSKDGGESTGILKPENFYETPTSYKTDGKVIHNGLYGKYELIFRYHIPANSKIGEDISIETTAIDASGHEITKTDLIPVKKPEIPKMVISMINIPTFEAGSIIKYKCQLEAKGKISNFRIENSLEGDTATQVSSPTNLYAEGFDETNEGKLQDTIKTIKNVEYHYQIKEGTPVGTKIEQKFILKDFQNAEVFDIQQITVKPASTQK